MWAIILGMVLRVFAQNKSYNEDWKDLDSRPLPMWYDVGKIGIFIHWGVYSVPAQGEWFWQWWKDGIGGKKIREFVRKELEKYNGTFEYQNYSSQFKAKLFEPDKWAELFSKAGAKYIVLTTKHHEGFALFPSKSGAPGWNSLEAGPKKDIVKELSEAVKKYNIKFGAYYSLLEWTNELYLRDKQSNFQNISYVDKLIWNDIKQLITDYQPSVLWLDGEWDADYSYWQATKILAWIYNQSLSRNEIVVNDRFGKGLRCFHGDFYNCEDRFNPRTLMLHKWENAFSLDKYSWGYRRGMQSEDVMSIESLIESVVSTVSCGGNVLINVGPTKNGIIKSIFKERLLDLGTWLSINGEAIYNTSTWFYQRDSENVNVWYTCNKQHYDHLKLSDVPNKNDSIVAIYAIFLNWPDTGVLKVMDLASYISTNKNYKISFLENGTFLNFYVTPDKQLEILLPSGDTKTELGWALKIAV